MVLCATWILLTHWAPNHTLVRLPVNLMWFWYHKFHHSDKKRCLLSIWNNALLHNIGDQNLLDIYFDQIISKQKYIFFLIVEHNYTKYLNCWYLRHFPNSKTLAFQIKSLTLTHEVGVVWRISIRPSQSVICIFEYKKYIFIEHLLQIELDTPSKLINERSCYNYRPITAMLINADTKVVGIWVSVAKSVQSLKKM